VACYRLGNAYEGIQESQTAIQVSIIWAILLQNCPFSITGCIWRDVNTLGMMKVLGWLVKH